MTTIRDLQPKAIWNYFADLCEIPRPSYHEQGVVDYLMAFAKQNHLEAEIDDTGNVIIRKKASVGMEDCYGIILQGHMDMVAQKSKDLNHDFEEDPINAYIEGDWVTAKGTTLGSDNGIGVAAALAVLSADELQHPPLEALFTVNEERGMSGALGLKAGYLKGDWLLNLDTEEDGELYVGCAGGVDVVVSLPVTYEVVPEGMVPYQLVISGLKGGHSGVDIHLGRANANLVTNEFLVAALAKFDVRVAQFDGGSLRNALPRDASTLVWLFPDNLGDLRNLSQNLSTKLLQQFSGKEQQINIEWVDASASSNNSPKVLPKIWLNQFLNTIASCPNGVKSWIKELPDVVQTSSNLARIVSNDAIIEMEISVRSSVEEEKNELAHEIEQLFLALDAKVSVCNSYPGWKPDMNSGLLQLMKQQYQNLFGKEAGVKVIHAGLECGVLGATYPHWQMISFGPTIMGAHSPDESVRIVDVEKMWRYLVAVLENTPARKVQSSD